MTLAEAQARLLAEIRDHREALDRPLPQLVATGLAAWTEDHAHRPVLIVRGQANLIDESTALDLERVRSLLEELEDRQEIARLLGEARDAPGCRIFIGSENRMFALSGSSVIAAPYRGSQGEVVGVVGVIGPTRLNYARVIPMVDFTAQGPYETDGMIENEDRLEEEAEEIRRETAEGSPEWPSTTGSRSSNGSWRKPITRLFTLLPRSRTSAAGWRPRSSRLPITQRRSSRETCWRSRTIWSAPSTPSPRSFAATKSRATSSPALKSTSRELDQVFTRHGITRVEAMGESLDPHKHQAMMEVPTADAEPGTIVQEMQPGYMLKDRLLRPALVGVARKP